MAVQHSPFILKVLSGANAGATVRLKQGQVVIGRSMMCDIILHDEQIAERHASLTVSSDNLTLTSLAPSIFIDGVEPNAETVSVPPYQKITLGGVDLTILDTRQAAPLHSPNKVAAQAQIPLAATTELSTEHVADKPKKSWSDTTFLALGVGLLLIGNLVYFAPQLWNMANTLGVGLFSSPESQAEDLIKNMGEHGLTRTTNPDGSTVIKGYVPTTEKRNEIVWALRKAGINANISIWSQQDLVDNAHMILHSMGEQSLAIENDNKAGTLKAKGVVSSPEAWAAAKQTIMNDVGGVTSIEDTGVQTLDSYMTLFAQFVDKKGLSSRLQLTKEAGQVIVKGDLTQNEIEQIKAVRNEFIQTYSATNYPAIVLAVTDLKTKIKLAIRSVSVGKVPYLVSKDGKKYMEGSKLGDNYFVKSIKPDHVLLNLHGLDIPFYYGIEDGNKNAAN